MSNELSVPMLNPAIQATGAYQFLNQPMLSQYIESDYSIFGNPAFGPIGNFGTGFWGGGFGYMPFGIYNNPEMVDRYIEGISRWNSGMADVQDASTNRATTSFFVRQGNNFVQNSGDTELTEKLTRLKEYIASNDMRTAGELFNSIYETISMQVGEELDANGNRVSHDKAVREKIQALYQQHNQTNMIADIKAYGSSEFGSGWDEAYGDGQLSADEMRSFVTGDSRQRSGWDRFKRKVGNFFGNVCLGFLFDDKKAEIQHHTNY